MQRRCAMTAGSVDGDRDVLRCGGWVFVAAKLVYHAAATWLVQDPE